MMMETQEEVLKPRRKKEGKKGRPPENRSQVMTIAAAAVSVLSDTRREQSMKVSDAIAAVANSLGYPRRTSRHFAITSAEVRWGPTSQSFTAPTGKDLLHGGTKKSCQGWIPWPFLLPDQLLITSPLSP
jgi:hypothetical protein